MSIQIFPQELAAVEGAPYVDKQVFTASGTWAKPLGARRVVVYAIGGGGRGGNRTGAGDGGGGGGGAGIIMEFDADDLPVSVDVVVGAGGTGNPATSAGSSSFGSYLTAGAGGAGAGSGGNAGGGGGGGVWTAGSNGASEVGGAGGDPLGGAAGAKTAGTSIFGGASGGGATGGDSSDGATSIYGGGGGGSGEEQALDADNGGASMFGGGGGGGGTAGAANNGGGGGRAGYTSGPAAGTGAAVAGTSSSIYAGTGGRGAAGAFQTGGNGGIPGGGGGGGGSDGTGGNGGRGEVRIWTFVGSAEMPDDHEHELPDAIDVLDTRFVAPLTTDYDYASRHVEYEFKDQTPMGLVAEHGAYVGLRTFVPWADDSGDGRYQEAYGPLRTFRRYGLRSGGWGLWGATPHVIFEGTWTPAISSPSGVNYGTGAVRTGRYQVTSDGMCDVVGHIKLGTAPSVPAGDIQIVHPFEADEFVADLRIGTADIYDANTGVYYQLGCSMWNGTSGRAFALRRDGGGNVSNNNPIVFAVDDMIRFNLRFRVLLPATYVHPKNISGMQLWLRGDGQRWQDTARTVLATDAAHTVACWDDDSGNGRHVLQATAANRPLWHATGGCQFDGISDYLQTAAAFTAINGGAYTIHAVVNSDSNTVPSYFLGHAVGAASTALHMGHRTTAQVTLSHWSDDANFTRTWDGSQHVHTAVYGDPGSVYRIDGIPHTLETAGKPAADLTADDPLNIGAAAGPGSYWNGKVHELMIFNRDLTIAEDQVVQLYLSQKYNNACQPVF